MKGDGRIYPQKGSPYFWCAYYDTKGKEKREVCLNRKKYKLVAIPENESAAKVYLRKLVDAIRAETRGGSSFSGS